MKFDTDFGTFEIDDHDTELAEHAADIATSARDFVVAWQGGTPGADGTCEQCGKDAFTRPVAAEKNGEPQRIEVCAECQADVVETTLGQYQQAGQSQDVVNNAPDAGHQCERCDGTGQSPNQAPGTQPSECNRCDGLGVDPEADA